MLIREPEKGTITLANRVCRFSVASGIIFVTNHPFTHFDPQFLDTVRFRKIK